MTATSEPASTSDVDTVAEAVVGCPAVARLSGGRSREIATYLPGRSVTGVKVQSDSILVHVVGRYGFSVDEIARQVRTAVTALAPGLPVHVGVDDLELAEEASAEGPAGGLPPGP